MRIALYSQSHNRCKVNIYTDWIFVRIALMFSEKVSLSNFNSATIIMVRERETWDTLFICSMFDVIYYVGNPNSKEYSSSGIEFYNTLKRIRNIKNKNKKTLIALQRLELLFKTITKEVDNWFDAQIKGKRFLPLFPFVDEGIFIPMNYKDYNEKSEGEDARIKDIVESFSDNKDDLVFDQVIENLVSYKRLDKETNGSKVSISPVEKPFFYSMELFEFTFIIDLNHPQLVNIRDELKPFMEAFNLDYEKFKVELAALSFNKVEQDVFQSMFNKYIIPHLKEIQIAIDKNIYIQQEKNRYSPDHVVKVILGITSIENQIRLLDKEEIILPFVANAILDKLKKIFDVENCAPFFYNIYPDKINLTP